MAQYLSVVRAKWATLAACGVSPAIGIATSLLPGYYKLIPLGIYFPAYILVGYYLGSVYCPRCAAEYFRIQRGRWAGY